MNYGFIKLSNQIFDYQLSPKALFIYAVLVRHMNALHYVVKGGDQLAALCGLSRNTVIAAIKELSEKGLVSKKQRFGYRGYQKNGYFIVVPAGGWFAVEREVFHTDISPVNFMLYCYIKKCMSGKKNEAFPSLRKIERATRLSHAAVSRGLKFLKEFTYINKIRRKYKRTAAFRHNRYLLYLCNQRKKGRKKVRSAKRTFPKKYTMQDILANYLNFKIAHAFTSVKCFICLWS